MGRISQHLGAGALYLLIPLVGALSSLVAIPALLHGHGAAGWAAAAVAQSIGQSASVIGEVGWGVTGPQLVARASREQQQALYRSALASRLMAAAVLVPISALAAFWLTSSYQLAAALLATASCLNALSPAWFLVGCNRPGTILCIETLPRLAIVLMAALAIGRGAPLELYGAASLLASISAPVFGAWAMGIGAWPGAAAFAGGPAVIRQQLPIALGRMVSVIYTALPITLVSLVNAAVVAEFAAVERLMRVALNVLISIPNRLQSWIGMADVQERLQRSRRSLWINAGLGLVGALGFVVLVPVLAPYLFAHELHFEIVPVALAAGVIFLVCVGRGYGLSLVAEGGVNWIGLANLASALVGVCAVSWLADRWGTAGGFVGELLAEAIGLSVQMLMLHAGLRRLAQRRRDS